jgi:hypothetical protein
MSGDAKSIIGVLYYWNATTEITMRMSILIKKAENNLAIFHDRDYAFRNSRLHAALSEKRF